MSIAARTLAYNWCGIETDPGTGHSIMDDSDKQHYNPHRVLDPGEAERYRLIAETTAGIYMTYQGNDFDAKYRSFTGSRTADDTPSPPHIAVEDLVGANYDPVRAPGLAQINSDHWASGDDPTPNDALHPAWPDYRFILIHYYTGIHIRDANGALLTPDNRWNPLSIDWGTPDNQPPVMVRNKSYPVTIRVQNTSIADWTINGQTWALSYHWAKTGRVDTDSTNRAEIGGTVPKGDPPYDFALTINDRPDWGRGTYTLKFDMVLEVKVPPGSGTYWFSRAFGWPTYDVDVYGEYPVFLPVVLNGGAAMGSMDSSK